MISLLRGKISNFQFLQLLVLYFTLKRPEAVVKQNYYKDYLLKMPILKHFSFVLLGLKYRSGDGVSVNESVSISHRSRHLRKCSW